MNKFFLYFIGVSALILLGVSSCKKPPIQVEAEIELSESSINVRSSGETSAIVITTSVPWVAESDALWCRVNPGKGPSGATTVEITVDPQPEGGYDDRECRITFVAGGVKSEVAILQRQVNALILTNKRFDLNNLRHEISIELQTNVECGVRVGASWIALTQPRAQTKALESLTRTFIIDANMEVNPRNAIIEVVSMNSPLTDTIYISQLGADLYTKEEFAVLTKMGYYVSKDSAILYDEAVDQVAWNFGQKTFRVQDYMQSKVFEILMSATPASDTKAMGVEVITVAPYRMDPYLENFSVDVLELFDNDKAKLWDDEQKRGFIIKYK